jgi:mRNA-degrading endonuclease RelE of RelBE toxin-antitoxin system
VAIEYDLHIPKEIAGRLGRRRAPVRTAIRDRLREIAVTAGGSRARSKRLAPKEPPLRFYVYEGYRVFYQVDPSTRRIVVLDLGRVAP